MIRQRPIPAADPAARGTAARPDARRSADRSGPEAKAALAANPKRDPDPGSNTAKQPDEWVSGGDPMTGAQASYLKTLSEQCGESAAFDQALTKAEASKRIDALKSRHGLPSRR